MRRYFTLFLCLIVAVTFGSTVFAAESPKEGYDLPLIDKDMLVFENTDHFAAVMSELIAQEELEDEAGGREGDDRDAPVFQDFAVSLGFESLLMSIETEMATLDKAGGVDDFNDPDDHQVHDPYFRGLLNPQGEVQVGGTIYRYYPHGYYEIDATDIESLDALREGYLFDERSGGDGGGTDLVFNSFSTESSCCRSSHSEVQYYSYAAGSRRMKAKQWVGNWGLYASVGGRTKNQKKGLFNWWWGEKADTIGVRGSLGRTDSFCVAPTDIFFQKVRNNDKKVTKLGDFTINAPGFPIFVKDYFDTTHWATDNGDSRMETLSMCECREATASFTLPSTSFDSSNVVLDGSASDNEAQYFIEIYRTNSVGSNTVVGNYWSNWFSGQVGSMNLANHYNFTDFGGGTVYRVKLAVQNGCTNWDEQVRWVTIRDQSMHVQYRAHVKSLGWLGWVLDGATAGTTGQNRRMEATQIKLINPPAGTQICYQAHVKGNGWMGSVCNGATAGTTGQSRRMEAIKVWLVNPPAGCGVQYRAHVKDQGWHGWVANGATAGTTGQSRRMEALEVKLVGCP